VSTTVIDLVVVFALFVPVFMLALLCFVLLPYFRWIKIYIKPRRIEVMEFGPKGWTACAINWSVVSRPKLTMLATVDGHTHRPAPVYNTTDPLQFCNAVLLVSVLEPDLQTILGLRQSYDYLTIGGLMPKWRQTSNIQIVLHRMQDFSWVKFTCKIVKSSKIVFVNWLTIGYSWEKS